MVLHRQSHLGDLSLFLFRLISDIIRYIFLLTHSLSFILLLQESTETKARTLEYELKTEQRKNEDLSLSLLSSSSQLSLFQSEMEMEMIRREERREEEVRVLRQQNAILRASVRTLEGDHSLYFSLSLSHTHTHSLCLSSYLFS